MKTMTDAENRAEFLRSAIGAEPGNPPCEGCRICCIGDSVRILRSDDASQWLTEPHPRIPGALRLKHSSSGSCIYLGDYGCTIHDRPRPEMCVTMDCRIIATTVPFTRARKSALIHRVWKKGKELLAASRKQGVTQ